MSCAVPIRTEGMVQTFSSSKPSSHRVPPGRAAMRDLAAWIQARASDNSAPGRASRSPARSRTLRSRRRRRWRLAAIEEANAVGRSPPQLCLRCTGPEDRRVVRRHDIPGEDSYGVRHLLRPRAAIAQCEPYGRKVIVRSFNRSSDPQIGQSGRLLMPRSPARFQRTSSLAGALERSTRRGAERQIGCNQGLAGLSSETEHEEA